MSQEPAGECVTDLNSVLWPINDRIDALQNDITESMFSETTNKERIFYLFGRTLSCQEHVSVLLSFLLFLFNCCLTVIGVILAVRNTTAEKTQSFHECKSTKSSAKVIFMYVQVMCMFEFKKSIFQKGLFAARIWRFSSKASLVSNAVKS